MKATAATFVLVVLAATSQAAETNGVGSTALPGSSSTIDVLLPYTSNIVAAVAQAEATVTGRHSLHMSTVMDMGGGETIKGGGTVTYAECCQTFVVSHVLAGRISTGEVVFAYGFAEESDAFPGPSQEIAVPVNTKVILFLGENARILKAIRDKPMNRNLVQTELEKAAKKRVQRSPGDVLKAASEK